MAMNKAPITAVVKKYELKPTEGFITDYKIVEHKQNEEGNVTLGYDKLRITVEDINLNKEINANINMGNTNATGWEEIEFEDENHNISTIWAPKYYTEYGKLKIMAAQAGILLIEDIEDIPPELVKEKGPTIQILQVVTEIGQPDLRDMYIKLDVDKRADKEDPTKIYESYIVKYLGKERPQPQKTIGAFGGQVAPASAPAAAPAAAPKPASPAPAPVATPAAAPVASPAAPAPTPAAQAPARAARKAKAAKPAPEPEALEINPATFEEVASAVFDFIDGTMTGHNIEAIGKKLLINLYRGHEWEGAAKALLADTSADVSAQYLVMYLDEMVNQGWLILGADGNLEFPAGEEAEN